MSTEAFYPSAEIRWFWRETRGAFDALRRWITKSGRIKTLTEEECKKPEKTNPAGLRKPFLKAEATRTDEYLLLPGALTTGVKLRQGRFEIKALTAGPTSCSLPEGRGEGKQDQWVKWSFDPRLKLQVDAGTPGAPAQFTFDMASLLHAGFTASGPWRKVIKDRCLLKYSLDSGRPKLVPPDPHPRTGCNVELTRIGLANGAAGWLSFGLEAFGPALDTPAFLQHSLNSFFTDRPAPPVKLQLRDSLSYPAWLAST